MIIPEGLMHKKVNLLIALLVIIVIAISAAFAISAQALPGIGLRVVTAPIKCVSDPPPESATCLASCPICGDIAGCASLFETKAKFLGGKNVLYKGQALCSVTPTPNRGGVLKPGSACLGTIAGFGPHRFIQLGCSR